MVHSSVHAAGGSSFVKSFSHVSFITLTVPTNDPYGFARLIKRIARIPVRFLSLMMVAFGSVTILVLLFDAPDTFLGSVESNREVALITFKAISVGSVFSVVGAATADSVFSR